MNPVLRHDTIRQVAVAIEDGVAEPGASGGGASNDVASVDTAIPSGQAAEEKNLEQFAEGSVVEADERYASGGGATYGTDSKGEVC